MTDTPLEKAIHQIEADPRSGQSLLLYGLISTLATLRSGHLYRLEKLAEMTAETRQLAYGLMEGMACGQHQGSHWEATLMRIDRAIRGQ